MVAGVIVYASLVDQALGPRHFLLGLLVSWASLLNVGCGFPTACM